MTVKELAKIAGVSPAAISIVLNNKKGVSDETRERILEILKEYNYANKKDAKSSLRNIYFLKYKKHGMLVELNAGFISAILDAVEAECRLRGYNLSMIVSDNNFEETVRSIDYGTCDALIVLGTELEEEQNYLLGEINKPYIVVDNGVPNYPCNSIAINNEETVYQALSYLAGLGHKNIAYFHSNVSIPNFKERCSAFTWGCDKFGFHFLPENQYDLPPTMVGAYDYMKERLKDRPPLPSCAFADNDSIAIGAIKALQEFGYRIPEDISVIGIDDIHFSAISSPPLTTMRIPKELIGTLAVRQLCDLIDTSPCTDVKTRLGGMLVTRNSTVNYGPDV